MREFWDNLMKMAVSGVDEDEGSYMLFKAFVDGAVEFNEEYEKLRAEVREELKKEYPWLYE